MMATVATAVLQLGPPADARFWFAGAIGPAVAGLSFKYRPGRASVSYSPRSWASSL